MGSKGHVWETARCVSQMQPGSGVQTPASEEFKKDVGGGATFNPKIINGVFKLKKSRY